MRTVLSTIGTPPHEISKYLVKIIQPTLNTANKKIKVSVEFVKEAEAWKISPTEILILYDIVNLYSSVPLDKAEDVIVEYLKNDFNNSKRKNKVDFGRHTPAN